MTSLAEQLRELKEEITPQKFATVVLGSLPESYDNFISSLNTTKVDELNWDNMKGLLIEEYKKREEKEDKRCNVNFGGNEALFSDKGNSTWSRERSYRRGGRSFGIQEIPGNITVKGQIKVPNATNVNKSAILLRTVHSIESMVIQALQNMIASSKMMIWP